MSKKDLILEARYFLAGLAEKTDFTGVLVKTGNWEYAYEDVYLYVSNRKFTIRNSSKKDSEFVTNFSITKTYWHKKTFPQSFAKVKVVDISLTSEALGAYQRFKELCQIVGEVNVFDESLLNSDYKVLPRTDTLAKSIPDKKSKKWNAFKKLYKEFRKRAMSGGEITHSEKKSVLTAFMTCLS